MNSLKKLNLVLLSIVLLSITLSATSPTYDCPVNPKWITNPSLPIDNKQETFCDFYKLSTQVFLYLMSPNTENNNKRNFEVQKNYPILENDNVNSCDDTITGDTLRINLELAQGLSTGQAGGGATIYDQNRNVVYYDVRFSKNLCTLEENLTNFPEETTELKFAWKVLNKDADTSKFITTKTNISDENVTLGLIGMHIAYATEKHPEFIWATYEHLDNTPDCTPTNSNTDMNFFFADSNCTSKLPQSMTECNFNNPPQHQTDHKSDPTNICRIHPYGTEQGDKDANENVAIIKQHNKELVKLLSDSKTPESMKVLKNYFTVGALWVDDITQNSTVTNQVGSLRLANTVAETSHQDVNLTSPFVSNCFGCHHYIGKKEITPKNNNITGGLSHIYNDILTGKKQK